MKQTNQNITALYGRLSCDDDLEGKRDFTVLRNVFNEWFACDTSKKIRAVKRAQGMSGRPLTSHAPYDYIMGEDGRFVVDPETAPVVKQIFSLCVADYGPTKIASMLCEQNIATPARWTTSGQAIRRVTILTSPANGQPTLSATFWSARSTWGIQ